MSQTIEDLRAHLFGTLAALRDKEDPMDLARAKAVSEVAQTLINSAKVEVDMINAVGAKRMEPSRFIGAAVVGPDRQLEHAPQATAGQGIPPQGPLGKL